MPSRSLPMAATRSSRSVERLVILSVISCAFDFGAQVHGAHVVAFAQQAFQLGLPRSPISPGCQFGDDKFELRPARASGVQG